MAARPAALGALSAFTAGLSLLRAPVPEDPEGPGEGDPDATEIGLLALLPGCPVGSPLSPLVPLLRDALCAGDSDDRGIAFFVLLPGRLAVSGLSALAGVLPGGSSGTELWAASPSCLPFLPVGVAGASGGRVLALSLCGADGWVSLDLGGTFAGGSRGRPLLSAGLLPPACGELGCAVPGALVPSGLACWRSFPFGSVCCSADVPSTLLLLAGSSPRPALALSSRYCSFVLLLCDAACGVPATRLRMFWK